MGRRQKKFFSLREGEKILESGDASAFQAWLMDHESDLRQTGISADEIRTLRRNVAMQAVEQGEQEKREVERGGIFKQIGDRLGAGFAAKGQLARDMAQGAQQTIEDAIPYETLEQAGDQILGVNAAIDEALAPYPWRGEIPSGQVPPVAEPVSREGSLMDRILGQINEARMSTSRGVEEAALDPQALEGIVNLAVTGPPRFGKSLLDFAGRAGAGVTSEAMGALGFEDEELLGKIEDPVEKQTMLLQLLAMAAGPQAMQLPAFLAPAYGEILGEASVEGSEPIMRAIHEHPELFAFPAYQKAGSAAKQRLFGRKPAQEPASPPVEAEPSAGSRPYLIGMRPIHEHPALSAFPAYQKTRSAAKQRLFGRKPAQEPASPPVEAEPSAGEVRVQTGSRPYLQAVIDRLQALEGRLNETQETFAGSARDLLNRYFEGGDVADLAQATRIVRGLEGAAAPAPEAPKAQGAPRPVKTKVPKEAAVERIPRAAEENQIRLSDIEAELKPERFPEETSIQAHKLEALMKEPKSEQFEIHEPRKKLYDRIDFLSNRKLTEYQEAALGEARHHVSSGNLEKAANLVDRVQKNTVPEIQTMSAREEAALDRFPYGPFHKKFGGVSPKYGGNLGPEVRGAIKAAGTGAAVAALAALDEDDRAMALSVAPLAFLSGMRGRIAQSINTSRGFFAEVVEGPPGTELKLPPRGSEGRPSSPFPDQKAFTLETELKMVPIRPKATGFFARRSAVVRSGKRLFNRGVEVLRAFTDPQFSKMMESNGMNKLLAEIAEKSGPTLEHQIRFLYGSEPQMQTFFEAMRKNPDFMEVPYKIRTKRESLLTESEMKALRENPELMAQTEAFFEYLDAVPKLEIPTPVQEIQAGTDPKIMKTTRVVKGARPDFYPTGLRPWMDWLNTVMGREVRKGGSLGARKEFEQFRARMPIHEQQLSYVMEVNRKLINKQALAKMEALSNQYRKAGRTLEQKIIDQYMRSLSGNEPLWADKWLATIISRDILAKRFKEGDTFQMNGKLGSDLVGTMKVLEPAYEQTRRGRAHWVEINGRRYPHSFSDVELAMLEAAASLNPRKRMATTGKPVTVVSSAMQKLSNYYVLANNWRSFFVNLAVNPAKLAMNYDWFNGDGDLKHGLSKSVDYWLGRLPEAEVKALQRRGILKGSSLREGLTKADLESFGKDGLAEKLLWWNVQLVDRATGTAAFYASKHRLERLNKKNGGKMTESEIDQLATIEALKIADFTHPSLHSPIRFHWLYQVTTHFQKPSIREVNLLSEMYQKGESLKMLKFMTTRVGIPAAALKAMGVSNEETARWFVKSLPFLNWTAFETYHDQGPIEKLVPALGITKGVAKGFTRLASDYLEHGGPPSEKVVRRVLPVGLWRSNRDLYMTMQGIATGDPETMRWVRSLALATKQGTPVLWESPADKKRPKHLRKFKRSSYYAR